MPELELDVEAPQLPTYFSTLRANAKEKAFLEEVWNELHSRHGNTDAFKVRSVGFHKDPVVIAGCQADEGTADAESLSFARVYLLEIFSKYFPAVLDLLRADLISIPAPALHFGAAASALPTADMVVFTDEVFPMFPSGAAIEALKDAEFLRARWDDAQSCNARGNSHN
ncbi:hypothetical protein BU23DRAFT_569430 [Bimuria novae-zelandiae CBS 107.79]|uniref:Uncharacterized protein n=1 Tax=Bimuria novae-zelandiae CBS 107.79 TaxID=1447943 RepID=A0A6A5V3U4_9PLEO|nr:hypothetical protein BU23DRAFT_569430 [Bimuria novae-zelandiae CBS 107.79]